MKVFVTATFKGETNKSDVENLCLIVREAGFEDFCFVRDVENYQKIFTDSKELMRRASEEIALCDALLMDVTNKPTGRAIEAGIAYAKGKRVILIAKIGTTISDTLKGIADLIVDYEEIIDIVAPLKNWLSAVRG